MISKRNRSPALFIWHLKMTTPARVLLLGGFVILSVFLPANSMSTPIDFYLSASAGAVHPDEEARGVLIDSTGAGTFCLVEANDRDTGDCTSSSLLALTPAELDTIWTAVVANDFFNLASTALNDTTSGGNWAELLISGNGQTYFVVTQNMAVTGFDNIMIALNSVLPPDKQILYNEILP